VVETQELNDLYETEFGAISDDIERKLLVKSLAKTSLGLIHAQLVVADPVTRLSVSMIQVIEMKTPSTTNSFESINEHLNKGTTRTNSF
jgi:hypothetical protein